jgi:FkbM family methyltransferase
MPSHTLDGLRPILVRGYFIYKKHLEATNIDMLRAFVRNGTVVIDVGANVGFFTRSFAEWLEDGVVIALEPEEQNFRLLTSACRRFPPGRIEAIQAAASHEDGMRLLELNPLNPADHKLSTGDTGVAIKSVSIDQLLAERDRPTVSLIKIDVQGAEVAVIRGARETIHRCRPALFVEIGENGLERYGTSIAELLGIFSDAGYVAHSMERDGLVARRSVGDVRETIAATGLAYADFLFLPETEPSQPASVG